MNSNNRKLAIWIALAACDRTEYWDILMGEEEVDWTDKKLAAIGLTKEKDGTYVEFLRQFKVKRYDDFAACRKLFEDLKGPWSGGSCPSKILIKKVCDLT